VTGDTVPAAVVSDPATDPGRSRVSVRPAVLDLPSQRTGLDEVPPPPPPGGNPASYRDGLLRLAELITIGCLLLGTGAALAVVRLSGGPSPLLVRPLAGWALLAAGTAVGLGAAARLPGELRRVVGPALLGLHLAALAGVVACAGGTREPFWVLFPPIVLVVGAGSGALVALGVGALAAAGVYTGAAAAHTLVDSTGLLLVVLPLFPTTGWVASAFSASARQAAHDAATHREAIERDIADLVALLELIAEGDLRCAPAIGPGSPPETTRLAVAFADTLLALRRLVRGLTGVGAGVEQRAAEILRTATEQVGAAGEQQDALRVTTGTIAELAGTAAVIAETAGRVTDCARVTMGQVVAGEQAVAQAAAAMGVIARRVEDITGRAFGLAHHGQRIAKILAAIDELAVRTDRLALGAAIEAARAGEFGAGFRNVSDEIRRLAERSRQATAEARSVLRSVAEEADATVRLGTAGSAEVQVGEQQAEDVVAALRLVASEAAGTVAAADEISVATAEQRVAAEEVAEAMTQLAGTSDRFTDGSRRYLAAAKQLRRLATDLSDCLDRFKAAG
jgi:methyl-accepting chemotaxis protein